MSDLNGNSKVRSMTLLKNQSATKAMPSLGSNAHSKAKGIKISKLMRLT